MKATILVLSLVFNLIALSVFGFFLHQKGGFTFVNEKITQAWESTRSKIQPPFEHLFLKQIIIQNKRSCNGFCQICEQTFALMG